MEAQIYRHIPTVATMRQLSTGGFIQSVNPPPNGIPTERSLSKREKKLIKKKTTRNNILNSITTWGVINGNIIVSDGKG